MAHNLLPYEHRQGYLMPPSLREWLPEEDLSWFIVGAVGQMELRESYAAHRSDDCGAAAYDPGMMVGVLLYAYCQDLRSSQHIARALERDVGLRAEREEALERLFVQVLGLCREARLEKLGIVAPDGTKMAANAALAQETPAR